MNLLDAQLAKTNEIDHVLDISILVLVFGEDCRNALNSLRKQLYRDFVVEIINPKDYVNIGIAMYLKKVLEQSSVDYVYMLRGENRVPQNALLEYARFLNSYKTDIVYADECLCSWNGKKIFSYQVKPKSSTISYYQNLYIDEAVVMKRKKVLDALAHIESEEFSIFIRELYLRILLSGGSIGNIGLFLLKKCNNVRNLEEEQKLLPLVQKCIEKNTDWKGVISRSSSYNPFSFELLHEESERLEEFVIVEKSVGAIKQLLSQVRISYQNRHIVILAEKKDLEEVKRFCQLFEFGKCDVLEKEESLDVSLKKVQKYLRMPVQIIMSDDVQWLNRMNVGRLLGCFCKPEVSVAVPQIATEGEKPKIVYAGADIDKISFTGSYVRGREQVCNGAYDLAWINREVTMLNPFCIALRQEMWNKIFPLNSSIQTLQQFAIELSFLCKRQGILCEYAGNSAFWVRKEIGDFYLRDEKTGHIYIPEESLRSKKSGVYWHWLTEYGALIEANEEKIPYSVQSYKWHIKSKFKAFNLKMVNETGRKRVLVFTHELSLTGAPLVLVQAVSALQKMKYDVLVVSPQDGPLRKTYCDMGIPVMIEPILYEEFDYIEMAYDFDFVIACTVVLWPLIEAFSQTDIPVLWWVHDSNMGYVNWLRYVLPEEIGDNIHLYCGGDYAQRVILSYRPKYHSQILLYGLQDFAKDLPKTADRTYFGLPEDKLIFANIAQIISRKGQDVLVEAIKKLPEELLKQCVFVFVGGVVDYKIYNEIMTLREQYPENVMYIKQISHELLKEFYREIDCIICSSTDDPLPAFVTEGLLMSRICICSKNTAFNSIIEDGKNGYLFESGNVEMLYQALKKVIENKQNMQQMEREARKLYEKTFSIDIFENDLKNVINTVLLRDEK